MKSSGKIVSKFYGEAVFAASPKVEEKEEGMRGKKMCSECKTGKDMYALDKRSPVCPYFYCHNGKKCSMYKKLSNSKNKGSLSNFFKKLKHTSTEK